MTAGFYENLILKAVIQKFEQKILKIQKKGNKRDRCVCGEDRACEDNDIPLRQPSC